MNKSHNIAPIPVLDFYHNSLHHKQDKCRMLQFAGSVAMRFAPTPSLRPPLTTLFLSRIQTCTCRPSCNIVTSSAMSAGCFQSCSWTQLLQK
ncbi:hypothetical protein TNCV_850071 [Trichonephila clavipes]|uniref:Uncharacterized protein n=1 Tax=Trichonephila clavipes TaxID=2585209 RepID=A0A8X6V6R8_TRICX|nr:hypothetical protein TNCV_850071 [Trichonephila clavipes]